MTPEAMLLATIEQHVESNVRLRCRLDWRDRRRLICRRWRKATGRSEAQYANAAAEWNTALMNAAIVRQGGKTI